jgi:ribonucleoside-diphosphate reductase alpha chain
MTTTRERLPNRRPVITDVVAAGGALLTVSAGIDPASGHVREVFLSGAKEGSAMDAITSDAAVVISVALQHGVPLDALARSIARIPLGPTRPEDLDSRTVPTVPASPIGAALDALIHIEQSIVKEVRDE